MKPFKAISEWITGRNTKDAFPSIHNPEQGWQLLTGGQSYTGDVDDYEQVYASVRPIAYRFSAIRPYALDRKGKRIENQPAVNALYRPNQKFGMTQFLDAIAVGVKTAPEIHILVWRREGMSALPGGEITKDNIAGYTFMEHATKITVGGKTQYQVTTTNGTAATFTDDEVITLADSRNPNDLSKGYSPTRAAKRWIRLDDYIADYQGGFFKNGAVPAGMFTIVAPSAKEFSDIVRNMQAKHRGADKNNNVAYSHTPIDPTTGKPATTSSIVWTPFNIDNRDMELGVIFDNVNKKIDSSFGVPATIRGVNESVTYAGAQVDERNFVVNVLDPFTNSIWSQFTHELNRITGGLGYAITYDLDIPSVADEEKAEAETKQIDSQIIRDMVTAGYSLDSIVDSFKLPESYKDLKAGTKPTPVVVDNPSVDEGGETEASPNPEAIAKAVAKGDTLKATVLSEKKRSDYENDIYQAAKTLMIEQIERAVKSTKAVGDMTDVQEEQFIDDTMKAVVAIQVAEGAISYAQGVTLLLEAGIITDKVSEFSLSDATIKGYRDYLQNVAKSYSEDTAVAIRNVLATANEQGLNRAEMQKALRNILETDDFRIKRLARTELNRSQNMASIDAIKQIQGETGIRFEKGFIHTASDTPCEYCMVVLNTRIPVDQPLLAKGDTLVGVDGGVLVNDFATNDGWDVHPNGHCIPTFYVVRDSSKGIKKSVNSQEIHCDKCDRYLGMANGEVKAVIKCSNSKCKSDNIIEIGDN